MTLSAIASLDIPTLVRPSRPAVSVRVRPGKVVSTDWAWMLGEAALGGGRSVSTVLANWDYGRRKIVGDERWIGIAAAMKSFEHRHLYDITTAEVLEAVRETEWPFGGVTFEDAKAGGIDDATSPAPLNLMLHNMLEKTRRVPTMQEFLDFHLRHPHVYVSFAAGIAGADYTSFDAGLLKSPVARAMRYRLATSYCSFIREAHFMCELRERHGVHLGHHFLLDAIWKIDFLHGRTAIEMFLSNEEKKAREKAEARFLGRKQPCHVVNPALDVVIVSFEQRREASTYKKPWLITEDQIALAAERLLSGDVDHRAGGRKLYQ